MQTADCFIKIVCANRFCINWSKIQIHTLYSCIHSMHVFISCMHSYYACIHITHVFILCMYLYLTCHLLLDKWYQLCWKMPHTRMVVCLSREIRDKAVTWQVMPRYEVVMTFITTCGVLQCETNPCTDGIFLFVIVHINVGEKYFCKISLDIWDWILLDELRYDICIFLFTEILHCEIFWRLET